MNAIEAFGGLIAIFFGNFWGIIGYFILKNDDTRLAKFCLHLSIVLTIISLVSVIVPFIFLAEELGQDFPVNV